MNSLILGILYFAMLGLYLETILADIEALLATAQSA
jgi:hypothetical protein